MSVFSISTLDRLIDSDRRSSSMAATGSVGNGSNTVVERKQSKNNESNTSSSINPPPPSASQRERRPLYVSYPYSSTTSSAASSPPPRPRSPSPTSFSPSPYIVNHKRRVPNGGVDSKRTSQQNGFHVSEKTSVSRPSISQEPRYVSSSFGKEQETSLQNGPVVKEHSSRSPQSSLTLQFQANNRSINSEDTRIDGNSWHTALSTRESAGSDEIVLDGDMDVAVTEEKAKAGGKRAGGVERREVSLRTNDPRGKKKVEESPAAEGSSSSTRVGNAGGSSSWSNSGVSDGVGTRTSSNSGSEEWFDAADGLPDYSSDDDSRRNLSDAGPSSRGDPVSNRIQQLKMEMQRRIAAEEARDFVQNQRDGMAQMLSSAGISVPQSEFGAVKITETTDKVLGVSDSESQRLMIARYVAGAVATGAVKAEAEAELQTVLAEKSKEIARLKDKLQYYEVVNHEMSQRNQESIESARQNRRRRERIQRFVVFGISAAICVGVSVAAVYRYAPWEHVKNGSVLLEGEQPIPVSVEQVVDSQISES